MRTSVAGKIENTALPVSRPLAPLYEAIHNSFQAIEDTGGGKGHSISIDIERLSDMLDESVARPTSFAITDTGVGFDDENATSFFTAESRHKAHRGGKGNGRFLWLKAFDLVEVDSDFRAEDGSVQKRRFIFDRREDQDVPQAVASRSKRTGTTVTLTGLDEKLSKQLSQPLEWFADRIIGHFLPYFRRSDCPVIEIRDGKEKLSLNGHFTKTVAPNAVPRTFQVGEQSFTLTGYRITSGEARDNMLVFAARGRSVKRERLARYEKGLERKLDNEDGTTSAYLGFVEGAGLDAMVRIDRLGFEIDEDEDDLFEETKSLSAIRTGALGAVREDLAAVLGRLREQKEEAVSQYVTQQAPEYRRLLKTRKSQVLEGLPPNPRPNEIEAALGRVWVEQQADLKQEGKALLAFEAGSETLEQYQKQMEGFLAKFEELNQTSLAQHIIHRRIVLNLLDQALRRDDDTGRYQLEAVVHRLVHPCAKARMRSSSRSRISGYWMIG